MVSTVAKRDVKEITVPFILNQGKILTKVSGEIEDIVQIAVV
jgi:hypothetical protein